MESRKNLLFEAQKRKSRNYDVHFAIRNESLENEGACPGRGAAGGARRKLQLVKLRACRRDAA
jgi:hypothetical protein